MKWALFGLRCVVGGPLLIAGVVMPLIIAVLWMVARLMETGAALWGNYPDPVKMWMGVAMAGAESLGGVIAACVLWGIVAVAGYVIVPKGWPVR